MGVQALSVGEWPKVAIIILNWNGWRDTIECLESVYQIKYPDYNVIVVDNGSEDESIQMLKDYCEGKIEVNSNFLKYELNNKPIKMIEYTKIESETKYNEEFGTFCYEGQLIIIRCEKNYGFSEGNNIAMRYALRILNPSYVLLLNNDVVVDSKFLEELIKVGESDKSIGIVGPTVYYYSKRNRIQSAGVKLHWNTAKQNVLRSNEIESIVDVDYVAGCALLAKTELIERIGYLDPYYFAYWEETDWCIRANKAGYRVICIPKSKIWHKGLSSSAKISGFHAYYMARNMFYFMRQHATRSQYILFILYFIGFRFWFTSAIYILYHKDINAFVYLLKGVREGTIGRR